MTSEQLKIETALKVTDMTAIGWHSHLISAFYAHFEHFMYTRVDFIMHYVRITYFMRFYFPIYFHLLWRQSIKEKQTPSMYGSYIEYNRKIKSKQINSTRNFILDEFIRIGFRTAERAQHGKADEYEKKIPINVRYKLI